ncbi:hypothetical protein BGHDH14_bgh05404 [Blumeria hordei DH14]|uniref:Uncharacterized protein n=1 Tax=Blumeria graminis f. sp. hordei (strain DH14) TaxID=546991 RepID=N1JFJ8_BLUG1|nr:hypothetical protein BGHDH14_bgh05404 [Blumeria hordei DH14]
MLLEIFQEDFVEWNSDSFAMVFPPILRRFKTFLMSRGIYVRCENNKRSTVAQEPTALLENDLDDLPQWPKRELDQMIRYGPEFQSLVFNKGTRSTVKVADNNNSDDTGTASADLKRMQTGKNKYLLPNDLYRKSDGYKKRPEQRQKARDGMETDSDDDSSKTYIPKWAKETPIECINTSRALMDLSKLYIHPQDKFGARHYERVLTLQKVIKGNPDKNTLQCLDLVIEKLQKIYEALRCNDGHKSHSLAGQLFAARQGVSACAQALIRPHNRFEDACAELRSTVKLHMGCTPRNVGLFQQTEEHFDNEEVDNGQYFIDRRYGGKLGYVQGGLQARGGRSSFKVDFEVDPAAITTAGRFASCVKRRGAGPHGTNQAIVKEESISGGHTWLTIHHELRHNRWIDGKDNPADAMTRSAAIKALENLIKTNKITLRMQGWVERAKTN